MNHDSTVLATASALAQQSVMNKKEERPYITEEEAEEILDFAIRMANYQADLQEKAKITDIEIERLKTQIKRWIKIVVPESRHLTGLESEQLEEWLDQDGDPVGTTGFEYENYQRYEHLLKNKTTWTTDAVRSVRDESLKILRFLENPKKQGPWRRRGMVVGYVQSGKTANFTALLNRAADVGYQVLIVLTGLMEDLRQQTQERLDAELIGYDSVVKVGQQERRRIGVSITPLPVPKHRVHSVTKAQQGGDFNANAYTFAPQEIEAGRPLLFCVKKNARILDNLNDWLEQNATELGFEKGALPYSLLLIDDECDQASVNTGRDNNYEQQRDITRINKGIRKILSRFERSSYVGYTATPFANIFIHPDASHADDMVGDDLFPKDFILMLESSDEYIGANTFFGFDADEQRGIEGQEGLPLVRIIKKDAAMQFPQPHKSSLIVPGIPESLKDAVAYNHLVLAMRAYRNQDDHLSMLVHVSRFVDVQTQVHTHIQEFNTDLCNGIFVEDPANPNSPAWQRLRRLFDDEIMREDCVALADEAYPATFEELVPLIREYSPRIEVKCINGRTKEKLEYPRDASRYYIAVGGDRLSRGLTLKGLAVSYFMRQSRMYDSLMQMGRWFGYRGGYLDLCRIWTTTLTYLNYRHVALAVEELKQEFGRMAEQQRTPLDFGLCVRDHPTSGLIITSRNKMKDAKQYRVSLGGRHLQTLAFQEESSVHEDNHRVVEALVKALKNTEGVVETTEKGTLLFRHVKPSHILEFLAKFNVSMANQPEIQTDIISAFIRAKQNNGELVNWTVAIPLEGEGNRDFDLAGHKISGVHRRAMETGEGDLRLKVLTSPGYEAKDLSEDAYQAAMEATRRKRKGSGKRPNYPDPTEIRSYRPPAHGLLVLYPVDAANSKIVDLSRPRGDRETSAKWGVLADLPVPVWGYGFSFPYGDPNIGRVAYLGNVTYQRIWEEERRIETEELSGDEDADTPLPVQAASGGTQDA